ncbi:hypothetical protein B0T20DRAFT_475945 [Sordaria brevicollis]|uniref:Uncharacterized protein n=1 Tax=Sordaria brevicollis TaxID=83679 RepID=A0AAE0PL55_SORBR|nr:hypothetical protein B0T20DRAFT_475945 [Sordaria brevicollis]
MDPAGLIGRDRSLEIGDTTSTIYHANRAKPTLPPHILAMVFEHLVHKLPISSTHTRPSCENSTYSTNYNDLINVSRACRQFYVLAKPLLLKNVALPRREVMCKFMEMLWRNPENRKHITHLSFQFPVNKKTFFSMTPMQLEKIRKDVRARPDGQSVKDAILSILGAEEGQPQNGSGSLPIWTAYFVHVLSMCYRLESVEIRLFTPWSVKLDEDGVIDLTGDTGNRILWDFLLRTGRLPNQDMEPESKKLAKDHPSSSWLPQYLRKVTVIFSEPDLPYDKENDNRIELDVVPNSDRLMHTKIMREVDEWVGSNTILHTSNAFNHNILESWVFLWWLLIEPERVPHLSVDEYRMFRFYLDRLKNIHFLKDVNLGEYIDSLQRLLLVSANAKKGGDNGDLDLVKQTEFCRAFSLLVLLPDTSEELTVSAMHGHLCLFDFLRDIPLVDEDEDNSFEDYVDPLKMRTLSLTHTRKQAEETEVYIDKSYEEDQVARRWFHHVDVILPDYPNLQALHLPLFLSYKLSEQAYIKWSGMSFWDEESYHDGYSWSNLSELTALKELTITFSAMTGVGEAQADQDILTNFFRKCLPPNLETLTLLQWWSWYYESHKTISDAIERGTTMSLLNIYEFLNNLAIVIVYERLGEKSLKSLKILKIRYLEDGPGALSSCVFARLKDCYALPLWKVVNEDLGIELVVEPYKCGLEHFGPCLGPWPR